MKDRRLWKKIEAMQLDALGSSLSFSSRLMRENGWTKDYADGAVLEYKRFIYIAAVSDGPVTPSDEVDQVWHLHLVYTEHYWGEFSEVIGKQLHHGPTKGGAAENKKYRHQYQYTLDRYEDEFSNPPPQQFWPSEEIRFSNPDQFKRVDKNRYWIIPKPSVVREGSASTFAIFAIVSTFAVGIALANFSSGNMNRADSDILLGTVLIVFVLLGCFILVRNNSRNKKGKDKNKAGDGQGGTGCGTGCGGCGGCGS